MTKSRRGLKDTEMKRGPLTKAGTALTAFAVCLDDVIDGEERDLFPMIQRALFGDTSKCG